MKTLREFLQSFLNNKGQHVFLSLFLAKICAFLGSLFIIRILPESEFGTMSIVASVFAIFAPFSGFGSQQSLLRYGSMSNDFSEKKGLSKYLFLKGLGCQIFLSAIFIVASFFYVNRYEDIFYIFLFFAIRLIGFYFFNHIQSELRVFGSNRQFAKVNNVINVSGLVLLLFLSYCFGLKGYLYAIAITPFIALFWYKKERFSSVTESFSFSKKELWDYGIHASSTALLSDALFSADVLLLGFLMNETAIANYRVSILIPANITFLALTFMQSDFPMMAKNYQNKSFLTNYITNYYKIFLPLTLLIFSLGLLWNKDILHFFFSNKYSDNSIVFTILLGGFCMNMLLRNLYGNLLSAVGKMKINTYVSLFTLVLLMSFSLLLVPSLGVRGMAISLTLSMLLSGLMLMFSFYIYLKKLNKLSLH